MLYDLLLIGIGLVVGWNVLPQPEWVKNLYISTMNKLESMFGSNDTD